MRSSTLILLPFLILACGHDVAPPADPAPASPPAVEAPAAQPEATPPAGSEALAASLAMSNPAMPIDGVLTGGQPSSEDLETLAGLGYKTVINLRQADESGQEGEADAVSGLGMAYVHLPVAGADGLTEDNARALHTALAEAERPLLLHCGSSNRVGALLALDAFWVEGKSAEEALALGRAGGMTRLEGAVVERIDASDDTHE